MVVQLLAEARTNARPPTSPPARTVEGNVITSGRDPQVRIGLPKSVQYVGTDRWVLKKVADCELHVFVEADPQKNLQRLYWVQFEGYLPSKPELKYAYDSPRHAKLGSLDFYLDASISTKDARSQDGSDGDHVRALLRAKGYIMPAGMMSVRLVHLLDERKRKELMVIYAEDVASTGFVAAELSQGGKAHDRWPAIEAGLIERAKEKISIEK